MKNIRFYLDYSSAKRRRKGNHTWNVIATHVTAVGRSWSHVGYVRTDDGMLIIECISSVFNERNSPVASSSVAQDYIRDCCKYISEEKAREIHPKLFEYLDQEG